MGGRLELPFWWKLFQRVYFFETVCPLLKLRLLFICSVFAKHYLRGSLAQCALSLKRLSAGPGFNPQTRQNKLFQDYWRSCFEINFSDRQEGLTVSSIICDR